MNPFKILQNISSPSGLRESLDLRILSLKRRAHMIKLSIFGFAGALSIAGLIGSCIYAFNSVKTSGFYDFATLVFSSDLGLYYRELGLSLIESLPVLGLAAVLTAGFVSVWTMIRFTKESRVILSKAY